MELAREIHKLAGAAMMPLVLLVPFGLNPGAPTSAHIAFAHTATKPIRPAQLCEHAGARPAQLENRRSHPALPPETDATPCRAFSVAHPFVRRQHHQPEGRLHILQQCGYQPDLAANGREALDALDRKPYDLVFMDLMMPEMDGLEATRAIRERQKSGAHPNYQPRILIVAMTAHAMQSDRRNALKPAWTTISPSRCARKTFET